MNQEIYLGGRRIAADAPVFIVAEMSANHLQDYDRAIEIIHAAKEAGRHQRIRPLQAGLYAVGMACRSDGGGKKMRTALLFLPL